MPEVYNSVTVPTDFAKNDNVLGVSVDMSSETKSLQVFHAVMTNGATPPTKGKVEYFFFPTISTITTSVDVIAYADNNDIPYSSLGSQRPSTNASESTFHNSEIEAYHVGTNGRALIYTRIVEKFDKEVTIDADLVSVE